MRYALVAAFIACAAFGPTSVFADTVTVPADTLARAEAAYAQLQANEIDRSTLTPALGDEMTFEVRAVLARQAKVVAQPKAFTATEHTDLDGVTTYVFALSSAAGTAEYVFGIDDATNKIAKLYVRPGPPA